MLVSIERCFEVINTQAEAEERYQTQLASYHERLAEAERKQALNPKQKVKVPKEPFAPQHAYTSLARAKKHLRGHELTSICESDDSTDAQRYAAIKELTKLGFFDPAKFLTEHYHDILV